MMHIKTVILCLAGITICQAATTMIMSTETTTKHNNGHVTHEPLEHGMIQFNYQHNHNMIVKTADSCYVVPLSADEQVSVHTDAGILALEVKIVSQLSSATMVTKESLSLVDQHACGHAKHYFTIP